jgi:O-antigen ligase
MAAGTAQRGGVWHRKAIPDATLEKWFARVWWFAMALLVISPGRTFGLGNTNPFERSVLLLAMLLFVWRRPVSRWPMAGLGLMALAIIVSGIATTNPDFTWGRLVMASVALFTMLGFLTVEGREKSSLLILRSVAVLPLLMVAFSVFMYAIFGWPLMQRDHTGASRLGGAVLPAFLAASCYAAVCAGGFLYCLTGRSSQLAMIAAALVISILSGSRMATACAAGSVVPFLFLARRSNVTKTLIAVYGLAALAAFLITAGDQLIMRFLSGSTSGRELMWQALEESIRRYPLLGIGFGHHGLLIPLSVSKLTGTVAAHNEVLRLQVELGRVGAAIFLLGWLIYWFRSLSQYVAPTLTAIVLIAFFMLYSTTDNTLFVTNSLLVPTSVGIGIALLQRRTQDQTSLPRLRQSQK